MEYVKYQRSFVMLEEQSGRFAMKQSEPSRGHIKLETGGNKGALRIGVQNIKTFEKQEYIYKLILFGKDEEKTIYAIVGTVRVGSIGSGESYFRFNPLDMDGKGNNISQFSHAIVAAVSTKREDEPLHPILKGNIAIKGEEAEVAAFDAEREEREEPDVQVSEAPERKEQTGYEAAYVYEGRTYNSFYRKYLLETCAQMEREADAYDRIFPFREDVTGAVWNKMRIVEELPIVTPMGRSLAENYRHYIFGASQDHYYIGIPGRFLREEQPEAGESGFLLWQPILGAEKFNATEPDCPRATRLEAYGYWIAAVTKREGDIVEA